jgi:hypothetical protein
MMEQTLSETLNISMNTLILITFQQKHQEYFTKAYRIPNEERHTHKNWLVDFISQRPLKYLRLTY